jgi:hypothetical protein
MCKQRSQHLSGPIMCALTQIHPKKDRSTVQPLNTSTPKPSLFNPQRSPSGTPRDDRTKTDRQTHNTHTKKSAHDNFLPCVFFFACLWRVFGRLTDAAQNAVGVFFFLLWVVFV